MPLYLKAFLVWVLIAVVEVFHGVLRAKLLAPRVGDFRSRQLAVFSGSALILLIAYLTFPWASPATPADALGVGGLWFVLMLAFELIVGHYVFKFSWNWLFADFNLFKGRLLALGMVILALAPLIAGRLRGLW